MRMKFANGLCGRLLWRIKKSKVPDENHLALVFNLKVIFLIQKGLTSQRQHTHAFVVHVFHYPHGLLLQAVSERFHFSIRFRIRANGKHFLHGALGDDLPFSFVILYHDRHPPAHEVERYLVHFVIIVAQRFKLQLFYM